MFHIGVYYHAFYLHISIHLLYLFVCYYALYTYVSGGLMGRMYAGPHRPSSGAVSSFQRRSLCVGFSVVLVHTMGVCMTFEGRGGGGEVLGLVPSPRP